MNRRYRAGFTCRLSKLKSRASKNMGASSRTIKSFFSLHRYFQRKTEHLRTCIPLFALHYTDIFSENRTSEHVKTFFRSSSQSVGSVFVKIRHSEAYLRAGSLCHVPPT